MVATPKRWAPFNFLRDGVTRQPLGRDNLP